MKHLVVMDIDGTLMLAKGAGARAMHRMMKELFELDNPFAKIGFAGRTDRSIIEEACRNHQLEIPDWAVVIERLSWIIADELDRDPGFVLPGVLACLKRLSASPRVALVLGTGNFRPCAYQKLAVHGLHRFFPVGGFGEDGSDRVDVIRAAIRRGREHYQSEFDRIIVVGDTPLDIKAAHEAHAACVGVATGNFSREDLLTYLADTAISDMTDLEDTLRETFAVEI